MDTLDAPVVVSISLAKKVKVLTTKLSRPPGVHVYAFQLTGCSVRSQSLALHAPFTLVETDVIQAVVKETCGVDLGVAVAKRACGGCDQATDAAGAVQSFLSGVTAGTGASAASNTARDGAHLPALTECLRSGGLRPVPHLHVVFGVEVVIATEALRSAHVSTGNSHESYAAPVVVHLHARARLQYSKPAARVKTETTVVKSQREVGELAVDLTIKRPKTVNIHK